MVLREFRYVIVFYLTLNYICLQRLTGYTYVLLDNIGGFRIPDLRPTM